MFSLSHTYSNAQHCIHTHKHCHSMLVWGSYSYHSSSPGFRQNHLHCHGYQFSTGWQHQRKPTTRSSAASASVTLSLDSGWWWERAIKMAVLLVLIKLLQSPGIVVCNAVDSICVRWVSTFKFLVVVTMVMSPDMLQSCYWSGKTGKSHDRSKHFMEEFCLPVSTLSMYL